jgi:hypothetical protein
MTIIQKVALTVLVAIIGVGMAAVLAEMITGWNP